MNEPIIIVGAGISGLRAASLLEMKGIECVVLEARDRIGGRVLSSAVEGRPELGQYDLGPTWFWPEREPVIANLVEALQLQTLEQYTAGAFLFEQSETMPPERHFLPKGAVEKSMRIVGGMRSLVEAIAATLAPGTVRLSTRVKKICKEEDKSLTLSVELADGRHEEMRARAVILAVPPRIIAHHITFSPELPKELQMSLLKQTTWMAWQAKAITIYKTPFWRSDGLSGHGISKAGPLEEIHDASNETGSGALFGFFRMDPKTRQMLGKEKVIELVVDQLTHMYGPAAGKPVAVLYKDWSNDHDTAILDDAKRLKDFPAYGLPACSGTWGINLHFTGTETSSNQGGHLEGALLAASRVVNEVLRLF